MYKYPAFVHDKTRRRRTFGSSYCLSPFLSIYGSHDTKPTSLALPSLAFDNEYPNCYHCGIVLIINYLASSAHYINRRIISPSTSSTMAPGIPNNYYDVDEDMDTEESNVRNQPHPPLNSPVHQALPINGGANGGTQQGQPAGAVTQQFDPLASVPHSESINQALYQAYQLPPHTPANQPQPANHQAPAFTPIGQLQSQAHQLPPSRTPGVCVPSTVSSGIGSYTAHGSANAQPHDSSGQSSDMILHPVHSGPARRETQAQQNDLVGTMDDMSLDPPTQDPK
ncbi:hypothetical protein D6D05_08832 [Aureobasidium pullulans]|nr:hypothetical protein D6D05_08832 [Aureobasidium pullulans]